MTARAWAEEYRTTFVCVDSYNDGILEGRFYNPYLPQGKRFRSLTVFLKEMEQVLDKMDFPRAYTETRTFMPGGPPQAPPVQLQNQSGVIATFAVRILFRQNASWQGSVTWLEGRQEQSFRSALELIFLIGSALEYEKAS